jgi:hypothetical protein
MIREEMVQVLQMDDVDEGGEEAEVGEVPYKGIQLSENEMLMRSQIFYELMKQRRSVRHFSSRPVPHKLIQNLIKVAGRCLDHDRHLSDQALHRVAPTFSHGRFV